MSIVRTVRTVGVISSNFRMFCKNSHNTDSNDGNNSDGENSKYSNNSSGNNGAVL